MPCILRKSIIQMTNVEPNVERNHAIGLVLASVGFLISSAKNGQELLYQIETRKALLFVSLTSKSSWLVKSSVVLVLVCVMPSRFQSN